MYIWVFYGLKHISKFSTGEHQNVSFIYVNIFSRIHPYICHGEISVFYFKPNTILVDVLIL